MIRMRYIMKNGILKNNKGVSLVLLALSIVVLFGFAALAIDIGHLYTVKNELQVAADFAALAGAEKLTGTSADLAGNAPARLEAQKIAALNFADVAGDVVAAFGQSPGANPGEPIPVSLQLNGNNTDPEGDIVVGNWDGTVFTPATGAAGETINAIKVTARRTGLIDSQPHVNNWFAKVLALLPGNPDFSLSNVASEAIAAKVPLKTIPIAVNEYWDENVDSSGVPKPGDPYDQTYPNSFVRELQVNTQGNPQSVPSNVFKYTFAILGSNAKSNMGSQDPNGYINLDLRTDTFFGQSGNFYRAKDTSNPDCDNLCTQSFDPETPNVTGENNNRGTTGVAYLANGYPNTRVPPIPVYEYLRPVDANSNFIYPGGNPDQLNVYNQAPLLNQPSDCPYATVYYFATQGRPPLNYSFGTINIYEFYPEGSRFMALVYDGTHSSQSGDPKVLTLVGYVPIEVDGYHSGNPKNIGLKRFEDDPTYAHNKSMLDPDGSSENTMYGHALDDIIQPDPSDPNGNCGLLDIVNEVANRFGTIKLVDPSLRYGLHEQP